MRRGRPRHNDILTPREWEVISLLREGLSNDQIAERLGISRNTTKFHVSEIFSKLGVTNREAAARWEPEPSSRQRLGGMVAFPLKRLFALVASHPAVASFAVAALASLTLAAFLSLHTKLPQVDLARLLDTSHGAGVTEPATAEQPQVQIRAVTSSAFNTVIEFDVYLAQPLKTEEIATVSSLGLRFGAGGEQVIGQKASQELLPDGLGLHVTAEFSTPLLAEDFVLSVGELAIVPNSGDGRVAGRGLRASARTSDFPTASPSRVPSAAGVRLDTGYGWSYVVDAVEFDATAIKVTYHVEGDIEGLVPLPPLAGDDTVSIPFPQGGASGSVLVPADGSDHVRLSFEAAGRPLREEASLRLVRSDAGSWDVPDLESLLPDATGLHMDDGDYISIRLTTPTAYTGRGSPGNNARLTDDLGNSYRLYHGSGSFPPKHSQWDFVGPLATEASELWLVIPGYLAVESGEWRLELDLR